MTKLRASCSALACGAVCLSLGVSAHATVSNFTIEAGSSHSNADNTCSGPVRGITQEDCTYNQSDPDEVFGGWVGPGWGATYYRDGDSPFQQDPGASPLTSPPLPDPDSSALTITGTLILDDQDNGACDGDDTISGRFELEAGTRAFSVGPSGTGEESWGPGTVIFALDPSVADTQVASAAGCEYIFGDKGFPSLIQTLGLTAAGVQTYPVDLVIGVAADIQAGEDAWAAPEPQGIGMGTFEGAPPPADPPFDGNVGVAVALDNDAFTNGTYQCLDQFSDPASPPVTTPDGCALPPASGTLCNETSATFCGLRRDFENWIIRIVVAPSGDITEGAAFTNAESRVLNANPPSGDNSWDGGLMTFTATCDNCTLAKNDIYKFVTGTTNPMSLDVGANDDSEGILGDTTLTVNPAASAGTTTVTNNGGNVNLIGIDYDANDINTPFQDTFGYELDDGATDPAFGLTADVSLTLEQDIAPVANAYTIDFDSQGVDPASLRNTTDVATVPGNVVGNNPTISDDMTAQSGTVTISGSEITYAANADFFQGTDTFGYAIDDDNFGSPGVAPESASAQVTVNIPNVAPTASDVAATVDAGESVDFVGNIELGNGTIDQHTADGGCDNGDVTIDGISVNGADVQVTGTYTAPADFEGEDNCTYTVTDEDGAGDAVDGVVVITVTASGIVVKLPGAGSALGPLSLMLLLLIPLLRPRRARRGFWS